ARDRIASSAKLEASRISVGLIPTIRRFFQKNNNSLAAPYLDTYHTEGLRSNGHLTHIWRT
ncbi:MAG: hypothetical protein J5767_13370, partial [Paludibacteraceae bacterium]|nr:hypothetical protein [Paludibacteraceae bacterium]